MLTDREVLETPVLSLRKVNLDEATGEGLDREPVSLNPESRYLRMRIEGSDYRFRITDSRTLELCVGDNETVVRHLEDLVSEALLSPADSLPDVRTIQWAAHAVKRHATASNGPTSPYQYGLYNRMVVSAPGYPGMNLGLITDIMAFRS